MNSNWRNRPTVIDYVSKDLDYIISIDESGNANLKQVQKAKREGLEIAESEKHFTVTACKLSMNDFSDAKRMIMDLKNKYWENALFEYNGIIKRVCFHSRDIRGRRGAFNPQIIDYEEFILDLSNLMGRIPVTLYASHIDKEKHVEKYLYPKSPYDLCMTFVLERIVKDIPDNETCIIVIEARGKKEDKELLKRIVTMIDYGTDYCSSELFKKIKGVYFNPKWCQIYDDKMSYWELELADLCAYPIQKYFAYGRTDRDYNVVLPKIAGFPFSRGRGLKSFP